MQRDAVDRCLIVTMMTLEEVVAEPSPIPATDLAAFDQRFAQARDRVLRICIGLVGADAAEDVVQDAYLRARSRYRQLQDPGRFDAWLTRTIGLISPIRCYAFRREPGRSRRWRPSRPEESTVRRLRWSSAPVSRFRSRRSPAATFRRDHLDPW
ncbi:MAG: hypothetical protein DLM71_05210 [Chloroflexi bacterium]|nr:MAG: hypothetical protein DLM71_05210 [Chloroflexota bacterium]